MTVTNEVGVQSLSPDPRTAYFPLVHPLYGRVERLADAPWLTTERLAAFTANDHFDEPTTDFDACPECYFQTSGTSGGAKRLPYSSSDTERVVANTAEYMKVAGMTPHDVVLNLAAPPPSMAGWAVKLGSERLGATVANSSYIDYENVIQGDLAERLTMVVGTPLTVLRIGEEVAIEHGSPSAAVPLLRTAILGGDVLPAHIARRLNELWELEIRMLYASVETGPAAIECPYGDGMHLLPGAVIAELLPERYLRPDVSEPSVGALRDIGQCVAGDRGELVISQFDRELIPLIHYRTGDIVEVTGVGCGCGRDTPRIKVLGRRMNMIEIGGGFVHEMQIDGAVSEALSSSPYTDWRARVTANGTDLARMDIDVESDAESSGQVTSRVCEHLAETLGIALGSEQIAVHCRSAAEFGAHDLRANEVKARRLAFADA